MIKKLFIALSLVLLTSTAVFALPTINKDTLSWTPPTTNVDGSPITDLKGYKVYWSMQTGIYTDLKVKDVGNVTLISIKTIIGQFVGIRYFVVTAYNVLGNESAFSNEVSASFFSIVTAPAILEIK